MKKIAVLFDASRAFDNGILKGIIQYIQTYTHWEVFFTPPYMYQDGEDLSLLERLKLWKPDAIIMRESECTPFFIKFNIPVIVNIISKGVDYDYKIFSDDNSIGVLGAKFFIQRGYSNFAYSGYNNFFWSQLRQEAYEKELAKIGHKPHIFKPQNKKAIGNWENIRQDLADWLVELPKPIALFTSNDHMAYQVIQAAKSKNILIPEDVAVLGVDNDDILCNLTTPAISSIIQETESAGFESAKLVQNILSKKTITDKVVVVRSEIIEEKSSTTLTAHADPIIRKAMHFIKNNYALEKFSIDDIAVYTGVSRRSLENKFKQVLKITILDEINRLKLNKAKELLLRTQDPIKEIAYVCGFYSSENFNRYFKSKTSMNPKDFRKKGKGN